MHTPSQWRPPAVNRQAVNLSAADRLLADRPPAVPPPGNRSAGNSPAGDSLAGNSTAGKSASRNRPEVTPPIEPGAGTPMVSRHTGQERGPAQPAGLMKAMSPGVVDYLFRQLVAGEPAEDLLWQQEGITLSAQPAGAELARRLAETDLEALTPTELFHYVRAAQRLAAWAEGLRVSAVERYCGPTLQENTGPAGVGSRPHVAQE